MTKKQNEFIEELLRSNYNLVETLETCGIDLYELNEWLMDDDDNFRETMLMIEQRCAIIIKMMVMNKAMTGDAKIQFDAQKLVIDKFAKPAQKQAEAEVFRALVPSIDGHGNIIQDEIDV